MKVILLVIFILLIPSISYAIVPHAYPATIIHQMGHIFFFISCIFISTVIVKKNLYKEKGWKYILIAEIFFAMWNLDAFLGHIAEFWIEPEQIIGEKEGWAYFKREILIQEGKEYLYYIAKHDHLWLVPGMLMFYLGLRELFKRERSSSSMLAVLPLLPIVLVDMVGSFLMIVLSLLSLHTAVKLYKSNKDNTLWNYMLWLSSSYVIFSLSRSLGHIFKQILIPLGYENIWKMIEPYSGSMNTFTFIVIGSVSLFFFRAYESYLRMLDDNRKIAAINADLTELNQELETLVAERTMSLMALTVADKVRNPAAVIGWTCKKIIQKDKIPQKLEEDLSDIVNECDKLESIVKDFELLLKSKQSMFKYEDVNDIIKGILPIVEKEAAAKHINILVNLSDSPLKINTQKNLLRTAIFHIIRNSIEATPEGGQISIKTYGNTHNVTISVSDTGVGIPKEDLQKIFDPFYSTKLYRFGMGLPLVKQIVSEHLGKIEVDSEVNKGTTFKLIFPVRWIEKK
jgi:signal transduction histidine kinase